MSDKEPRGLQQIRNSIVAAFALSAEYHMPAYVYRPARDPMPYVITLDEDDARTKCDADGFTVCDASQEGMQ